MSTNEKKCVFNEDFDLNFFKQNEGIINGAFKFLLFTNDDNLFGKFGNKISPNDLNFDDWFDVSVEYSNNQMNLHCEINTETITSSYNFKGIKVFGTNYFIDNNSNETHAETELTNICTVYYDNELNFSNLSKNVIHDTLIKINFQNEDPSFDVVISNYENKTVLARSSKSDEYSSIDTTYSKNLYLQNAVLNISNDKDEKINIFHGDSNVSICYNDDNQLSIKDNKNQQPNIEIFANDNIINSGISGYLNIYGENNHISGNDTFLFNSNNNYILYDKNVLFNSNNNTLGNTRNSACGLLINSENIRNDKTNNVFLNSQNITARGDFRGENNTFLNSSAINLSSSNYNLINGNNINISESNNNVVVGNDFDISKQNNSIIIGTSANYISADSSNIFFKNSNGKSVSSMNINHEGIHFINADGQNSKTNEISFFNSEKQCDIIKTIGQTELLHSKYIEITAPWGLEDFVNKYNVLNNTIVTVKNTSTNNDFHIQTSDKTFDLTIPKNSIKQFLYIDKNGYAL